MKQTQLQDNITFAKRNLQEQEEEHDKSGLQIFEMDGLRRKQQVKLSPIVRSDSFQTEQLILQYSNPMQIITPKHETITERLQTFGQTEQVTNKPKSFRKLIVYFHQKDFIKILLAPYKLPTTFNFKHFQLINDLASSFKQQIGRNNQLQKSLIHQYITLIDIRLQVRLKLRTIKVRCKQYIQFLHNQIPLIEPMSNFKFFWDLICFGIRIYLIVVIPVLVAFHDQSFSVIQSTPLTIFSLALIFDIVLRAFTVTYDKGLPVRDRYLLYKKQLTVSTLLEFISFIITLVIAHGDDVIDKNIIGDGWPKFLLMLHYIQIFSILKYIDIFQYSLKLSRMATSIVDLIKLITLILLVQHVFSCIWLIFGFQSQQYGKSSWMEKFYHDDWSYQFLQSFYFICVTTFTVGYGDLLPESPHEQIFTIFYMFLCMLLFSYTVNTIGSILTQIKETSDKIKQKITAINEYMHNKAISPALQFKVREQLYFFLKQEVVQQVNEQSEIIKLLPDDLQHSLKIEAALSLLNKCTFFSTNFPSEILNKLLENVDFTMYQPGATILSKEEFYVHIIEQGSVDVIYKKKIIQTLHRFDYFGLQEFLTQQQNEEIIYKSTAFTSILSIPYSQFRKILEENDVENQKFHNLLQQQQQFQNYCFICQVRGHQTLKCPVVHFIPNNEVVIKRYLYRKKQKKRVKFTRRTREISTNLMDETVGNTTQVKQIKFSNSCIHQKLIENAVTKYKQDNENIIEQIFPTLEQPSSIGSQSDSENEEIEDLKEQSFSVQNLHSRRESKKMTILQPPQSSNNLMSQTIVNRIKKHGLNKVNQPQSPNPLTTEFYGQLQHIRQVKKMVPSKPGTMELDEQFTYINKIDVTNELRRKMNNIILYPKREQEQIEHCYKTLVNLQEEVQELENFEILRNYEIFNRFWNIDSVIKRLTLKQKKFRGFKKLKRFLLFPFVYVSKYLDKRDSNDPNKPQDKQKRKRLTRPKVVKKTRVTPEN